jgi:rubrerythrin
VSQNINEPKKRGRPRTQNYQNIGQFLMEFETLKCEYLMQKEIIKSLEAHSRALLEKRDFGRHVQGDYTPLLRTEFKGQVFQCSKCGRKDTGTDFLYDPDHDPPRLRVTLKCGHRMDFPLPQAPKKCPSCGGEVQKDSVGFFCILCPWKQHFGE